MSDAELQGIEQTQNCYCLAARRYARELTRRYEAALRSHGLRATQFSVLAALAQTGSLPISRFAEILGLERTTLTRVAGVMKDKGWLEISVAVSDERIRYLTITKSGKNKLKAALPDWQRIQDEVDQELKRRGDEHDC